FTEKRPEVVSADGEEARVELAFGREAGPGAAAAERLGDRGDHAHLAGAVAVAPAVGDLAGIGRLDGFEGELGIDGGDDLRGRDDVVEAPAVRVPHVHVLDEPQRV